MKTAKVLAKFVSMLALLVLCAVFGWAGEPQPKEEKLRVATRLVPPFVFEEKGRLAGFSVDLWGRVTGNGRKRFPRGAQEVPIMSPDPRIGLIIPSSNRLTEPQFHRYAPPGVGVHVARIRMTGQWHRPLRDLRQSIAETAGALSDTRPGLIVFHCTASSMEEGLKGESDVLETIEKSSGCPAITTAQAIAQALSHAGVRKLVLISPYIKETNQHEVRYLREAGFEVIHELGLGLRGGDEYITVTPERWKEVVIKNARDKADGYLLSCTNTTMIEAIEDLEERLGKPVITSNQATLWLSLHRIGRSQPIKGLGRLFQQTG
ncbi:MAG: aspartate/glutamate racemase family protein [Deltaproteobacteria bacterium]|nr:aspartate/glutamate racemase family protein [Deltaproteobacteria bacterium]